MESGFDFFKGCLIFLLFILVGALIGGLVATLLTHMYIQGSDLKDDPGVIYVYLSYSFIGIIIGSVVGFVACQIMNIIIEKKRYNYWRYGG
tara:strand:+ start:186 stop:458 length:273 start_codon:yes stop_codon:yes gene_type:complete